jgi:arginase family enzyme
LEHEGGIAAELDFTNLSEQLKIADGGNHSLESAEQASTEISQADGIVVALGGDHLVPYPLVRGLQQGRPRRLGLMIFDSHLDLHPSPPLWAGSQWHTLIKEGILRPEDITIIGPRGVRQSIEEIEYARQNGITVTTLQEIDQRGLLTISQEICQRMEAVDEVYISLDIDVVDPAFCPAQKYPDAAGMAPREILTLIRRVTSQTSIAGFDLCCFSPRYDEGQRGALLAARFALEAIYSRLRRKAEDK